MPTQTADIKTTKDKSLILTICDKITKYSIFALVFFMPIFFLPFTSDILDFNKQALLALLVFVALFSWMLKTLISGKFTLNINKTFIGVGLLVLAYLCSMIFSVARYGSFWGWPQVASQSVFSLILLAILYFLVSNEFSAKEISHSFVLLAMSAFLIQLYGVLQILGLHIIPFAFAANNSFNTIGSLGALGFFAALLMPLFIIIAINTTSWKRALFMVNILLAFLLLVMIDYNFLWWMMLLGSLLITALWTIRRNMFDARWISLPVFFLIISLFFIVLNPQISWLPQKSLEVSLSQSSSVAIDAKVLKSLPLLGSGPGTFVYDFEKYKSGDINQSSLWNIILDSGASKIVTTLATVGILGLLALLSFLFLPVFYGARHFIFRRSEQDDQSQPSVQIFQLGVNNTSLILAMLVIICTGILGFFLYNSNMALDFIFFFCVATLVSLIWTNKKTYTLTSSSLLTLIITLVFTTVFIFGLGFLLLEGQRYVAEVYYYQGLVAFNNNNETLGIKYVKTAAGDNSSVDLYFNQLSLFSLQDLKNIVTNLNGAAPSDQQKSTIQTLMSDSINAANIAINLGNQNVENWSTKGYACQSLIGLVTDAPTCAIASYDKAIALNPVNPYLYLQEGNVYLSKAANLPQGQTQNESDLLSKAFGKFNKAIALKPDYALAYFQEALAARLQNNTNDEDNFLHDAAQYSQNDASMALQIGLVYYQDQNWQKAQSEFQYAVSLIPNYANALYYLGLTYANQAQPTNAILVFSKLLQLNPNNTTIKAILANLNSGKDALTGLVPQAPPLNP